MDKYAISEIANIPKLKILSHAAYFDATRRDTKETFSLRLDDIENIIIKDLLENIIIRVIIQKNKFEFVRVIGSDETEKNYLAEIKANKKFTLIEYANGDVKNAAHFTGVFDNFLYTFTCNSSEIRQRPDYIAVAIYSFNLTKPIDINIFS